MPAKERKERPPKDKKGKDKGLLAAAEASAAAQANESPADRLRRQGVIITFALNADRRQHANARDIAVENLTMTYHGSPLIEEAEFSLNYGNRYGFLGRNGCGKSTFMNVIAARSIPIPEGIDIYHVAEEIEATEMTALEAVMSVDQERAKLEREVEQLNDLMAEDGGDGGNDDVVDRITQLYERLEELDAATAETRASKILAGLGFTPAKQAKMTKEFSGGWRMRIALARALFIQPTLLLLDEPTNHLDMEAVVWLEDYLSKWNKILFMVSHSQDFLNNVCTHMVHLFQKKLILYTGNYDQFCQTRAEKDEEQEKRYKLEQDQINHMKEYVARFGQGNAKMAKQAQSKEKVLDKMLKGGLTDKVVHEKPLDFKFNDPDKLSPPVLQCNDITFGYPGCEILYSGVDFGVDLDSRVALVGPNGAGKTTLLKIMTGELMPVTGAVRPHAHLRISKFTQHFVDVLDLDKTPLEYFMHLWPDLSREDGRKFLGRFGISGSVQTQIMGQLSDGQKSRVVLAKMAKENPHMLFLDEPTNHLDMESIDSLAKAINAFGGGLVLVSHDMRLISQVAKEIWMCDNRTVTKFVGEINDFKLLLRRQMMRANLIDNDGKAATKDSAASTAPLFVPLAPLKSFSTTTPNESGKLTVAPPLAPKAAAVEDPVLRARMELAEMAIAKQRARQAAGDKSESEPSASVAATADDEDAAAAADKAAQKAQRKAEKEAKEKFEREQEEERIRRKEEKAREIEEAKRLVDQQNKARDEWAKQKAEKDAKIKEAEDAEAARVAEALSKRREEKEARRKAREDARLAEEQARREAAERAVLADPWTQEQQDAFEQALLTFTSALEKAERWSQVAAHVQGKSRNQCLARYRFIKEFLLREAKEKAKAAREAV